MEHAESHRTDDPFWTLASEAINRALWLDPDTLARLGEFDGRVIAVEFGEPGKPVTTVYVVPSASGLRLRSRIDGEPNVTISGHVPVFARLLTGARALHPTRDGGLNIRGDLELGQRFQRVLERIDLDWEEPLSRVVGDIAAHRIGRAVRTARGWVREAGETILTDAREYLQEESRLLAPHEQVERFLREVDRLRADVDRLESRINRLRETH